MLIKTKQHKDKRSLSYYIEKMHTVYTMLYKLMLKNSKN